MEQRMQIMAITDPAQVFGIDLQEYMLISEGHYASYVKKDNLRVNIKKMRPIKDSDFNLYPEYLKEHTEVANITNHFYRSAYKKDFAVKINSQSGASAWINHTWLKQFGDSIKLRMSDKKSPVYITDIRDNPLGFILPITIKEDSNA